MSDKMRNEFEASYTGAVIGCHPDLRRYEDSGDYMQPTTYWAWWAWQTSRSAVVIELPYVHAYPANEASSDQDYYMDQAKLDMRHECKIAIEAAGVKCK